MEFCLKALAGRIAKNERFRPKGASVVLLEPFGMVAQHLRAERKSRPNAVAAGHQICAAHGTDFKCRFHDAGAVRRIKAPRIVVGNIGRKAEHLFRIGRGFVSGRAFGLRPMRLACGSEIGDVIAAGCDTFVTADLKYNHFEEAKYRGLNLIDAGHFETENPVCDVLEGILREAFPEIPVFRARTHRDETQFL